MGQKGWYTASQVVNEALFLIGDVERKRYEEAMMQFARAYRDFCLFHKTSFSKVWLPITPVRTVALPDDFVELVFVGTVVNGELFAFTRNTKMVSPIDPLEKTSSTLEAEKLSVSPLDGYATKGVNVYEYFNLNIQRNRIELKQAFMDFYQTSTVDEVYMGYISNDVSDINKALIPLKAVNMITNHIAYQMSINDGKPFVVQTRKYEFEKEALKYDALDLPTADELLDAIFETSGQSIRR